MTTGHRPNLRPAPYRGLDFSIANEFLRGDNFMGDCLNVLIEELDVVKRSGYSPLITGDTSAISTKNVMDAIEYTDGSGNQFLIFALEDKLIRYNTTGPAWTEITGLSFTGDTDDIITMSNVSGVNIDNLFITNGVDTIKEWDGSGALTALDTDNFSTLTAKTLIGYAGHLLLGDVTEDGSHFPYRIRWSAINDPGAWNTGSNESAGFTNLTNDSNNSKVQMFLPLSTVLACYKEDSIYNISYEGSRGYFVARPQVTKGGAISRRAAATVIEEDLHLVVSKSNIHLYDGNDFLTWRRWKNLGDRIKKNFFDNLNWSKRHTIFVTSNPDRYECYIAMPKTGSSVPNRVYVWNWDADAFTILEFNDTLTSLFLSDTFFSSKKFLMGITQNVMEMYNSNTDNGTNVNGWFRTKLDNYGSPSNSIIHHVELDYEGELPVLRVGKVPGIKSSISYGSSITASLHGKGVAKATFSEVSARYNTIEVSNNTNSSPFKISTLTPYIETRRSKK
jgi:hypothetical protein